MELGTKFSYQTRITIQDGNVVLVRWSLVVMIQSDPGFSILKAIVDNPVSTASGSGGGGE